MTQNEYVLSAIPNPLVLIIILLAIGCFIFAIWIISLKYIQPQIPIIVGEKNERR